MCKDKKSEVRSLLCEAKSAVEQANKKFYEAVCTAADTIERLPNNPKIIELSGVCNAFITRAKDLGDVWSPEYLNWGYQYKAVADAMRKDPLHALAAWEKLRIKRVVKAADTRTHRDVMLHPAVISRISDILK